MILTTRDQTILKDLQTYALFTTRQIAARYFPSVAMTTVLRRLRTLESEGYTQRISGLDGGQNAWALTKMSAERFFPQSSKVHFPRIILDHDLALTNLRLKLEEVGIVRSWRAEHEIRSKVAQKHGLTRMPSLIVPDGLMGIEHKSINETVAVELELSAKNQTRYRKIFQDYSQKQNLWGFWYVVRTKSIGRQLMTAAKNSRFRGPYFLWSLLDDVMSDPLNARIHSHSETYKIAQIWKPLIAHRPAQGMSGQRAENESI